MAMPELPVSGRMGEPKIKDFFAKMLYEMGYKLELTFDEIFQALALYHQVVKLENIDADSDLRYYIAAASCYIILKYRKNTVHLEMACWIFYETIFDEPIEMENLNKFQDLTKAVGMAEVLILRSVGFNVIMDLPHNYMLPYVKIMVDFLPSDFSREFNLPKLCHSLMCDFMLTIEPLKHHPKHVALAIISVALNCFSSSQNLPELHTENTLKWAKKLDETATKDKLLPIMNCITSLYS